MNEGGTGCAQPEGSGPAGDHASPLVSVVLPVYHVDPGLFREAVRSLLRQTLADFELIIVEADAVTASRDLVSSLADARLRYQEFRGEPSQSAQYNAGLALARAPYIARADADDLCHPSRLERQLKFLEDHTDVDVLGSAIDVIDERGDVIGSRVYPLEHDAILRAMPLFNPIANPTVMFRRSVIERCGPWEESQRPARDYEWASRVARAGGRFANLEDRLVAYRIHGGAVKSSRLRASIRATLEIKRRYWSREMSWRGRVRMLGEWLLLLLPESLVMRAFRWLTYRRPAASS